jgi:hypothetical protein
MNWSFAEFCSLNRKNKALSRETRHKSKSLDRYAKPSFRFGQEKGRLRRKKAKVGESKKRNREDAAGEGKLGRSQTPTRNQSKPAI